MLETGAIAPEFTLIDIDGVEKNLDELLARDPIILAFFKISCPVCQLALPFLERLYSQRAPVFGVSQDDARLTREFAQRFRLNLPMLLDSAGRNYPVSNAFGITNVPSIFEIDKERQITWASTGFVKKELTDLGHRRHLDIFHPDDNVPAMKAG